MYVRRKIIAAVWLSLCGAAPAQSSFNINLDFIRQAIVFLRVVDAQGQPLELGTGFLIRVPVKGDPTRIFVLLATARHMADPGWMGCPSPQGTLLAVFNKKQYDPAKDTTGTVAGSVQTAWVYPDDDNVDVAVTLLNGKLFDSLNVDATAIPISDFITPDELKTIGAGAQIASAGLLVGTASLKRNYPVFKFGYVSSIPEEMIPVGCKNKPMREWLLAASLVRGNSGSPIFFVPAGFSGLSVGGQRAALIGVQSSNFEGADVAGMAPSTYLMDAIRKLPLPGADLPAYIGPAQPTWGIAEQPQSIPASTIPAAHPSQKPHN